MSATITYKGETLETLNGGEYVTLHTNGKTMEDDIRVEVAEVSGGDIAINGIVEQYKVNAGATVNAGDFVEFVNKYGAGVFFNGSVDNMSACKLDNNRVLVSYIDSVNGLYIRRGAAVVLTVDNDGVSVGESIAFKSGQLQSISATALSENKVLVAYEHYDYGYKDYNGCAIILTVSGTTIAVGEEVQFSDAYRTRYISATTVTDSKAVVAYAVRESVSASYDNLHAVILTVSDTTITTGEAKFIGGNQVESISAVTLSADRVVVAYVHDNYGYAVNLYIDDTDIYTNGSVKFASSASKVSTVALTDSKVLIAYTVIKTGTSDYYGKATVLAVGDSSIAVGGVVSLCDGICSNLSAVALTENKALVTYRDDVNTVMFATILTVSGTGIMSESYSESFLVGVAYDVSSVALTENGVLVAYIMSSGGKFTNLNIANTSVTPGSGGSTYVQPATSRLHNVGVAKTSGTEGQMVDVYCVGGESV